MPIGVKSILAKLYIARRLTLSASVAVLVIAGGAIYAVGYSSVTTVESLAQTAAAMEETAVVVPELPADKQADKQVAAAPPTLEKTVTDELPANVPSAFATAKEEAPPVEVAAAAPMEETKADAKEEVPPVRQIIPVAEGLDLYRQPSSASHSPPHVADQKPTDGATDEPDQFALPTVGVPTEDDLSGFLAVTQSKGTTGETGVTAQEDLSPTITLPDAVPLPESRPAPGAAAGQTVEFRIVQGPGVKSGFWIGNKDDAAARRFFVIVKPFLEDGTGVNWKFTNIADGSPSDTDTMAVEVTEDAFIALAREAKELGSVKDPVLGRGVAGRKNVKWRISSVQGNLLAGWDKEGRK
jgi:hypothetical protein